MVFVPEGQHDSSQARSAWVAMQKGPVPEGRLSGVNGDTKRPQAGAPEGVLLSPSCLEVCVLYSSLYGYSEEKRLFTTPP